MVKEVVLGIDLGTSAIKIIAVDQLGNVIESVSETLKLYQEHPGYSEQDPNEWFEATKKGIKELIQSTEMSDKIVKGISFSGQMHGLVIVDDNGIPLRKAILWNDTRNSIQCRQIEDIYGERLNYNPILEGFTLPKMLWVQQHEPEIWNRVDVFMLPKDYLRYCLTQTIHMEYSDACSTLLFNPENYEWTRDVGDTFNIGDNACGAIGAGVIHDKSALCSIGTSGVVLNVEYQRVTSYDSNLHLFNHSVPDTYYAMGVTLAAGYSLNWLKQTFFENESFEEILNLAASSKIGANGLLFTPYLAGERTPHGDAQIRGSFIGISGQHTKADFARAVIEGITYSLYDSIKIMRRAGHEMNSITSIGGGAKSRFWLQLQADIFNLQIKRLKHEEGPSMGAAILAAYGLGWFKTIESCVEAFIKVDEVFEPNNENHDLYEQYYSVYEAIYKQTKQLTADLLTITN